MELTYDHEGRTVGPGHRGASLAVIGEGPYSRVLRGRVGGGEIALKIQKESAPESNTGAQARWAREFDALTSFGGEEPGLVSLEPVPGFGEEEGPPLFEPLFLCREVGQLFHLPCPRCLRVHVLVDCRDDAVLESVGLPAYSSSTERFLWCSACGREDPVFYTQKERKGPAPVKGLAELLIELGSVVDRGSDEDPVPSELLSGLEQDFPCQTCEHRAACYPHGAGQNPLAPARVIPFAMNEFHAWPLPLCQLNYDEAADLLSGARPADLMKRYSRDWASPAIRRMKEEVIAKGAPPDPVEALAAKLDIFAQAVQSVHRLHSLSRQPHLALSPRHLLVQPGAGGTPLVRLVSPESPRRLKGLRLPPFDPLAPYAAPALLDGRFGREYRVRVHIQKIWTSGGDTFFAAGLDGTGLPLDDVEEKDEIRLTLDETGWEDVEIWCRRLPGEAGGASSGALAVVTAPEALDMTQVNDLKSAKGQAPIFGKVSISRDFGIALDIYSLGMLLFRSLLVNQVQSWERVVEEFVVPVCSTLGLHASNRPNSTLADYREVIAGELDREPTSRIGGSKNVWNRPDEANTASISGDAWLDLLALGFRAVTHLRGFSFCESDRDDPEDDLGAPTLTMLGELERISGEVAEAVVSRGAEPSSYDDEVLSVQPLTQEDLEHITGEVESELRGEIDRLRGEVARSRDSRRILEEAWRELYLGVVGIPDKDGPPRAAGDVRVPLVLATVSESIECIAQIFKGIGKISGDELGENVPKIRVLIQDAIRDTQDGKVDVLRMEKKIKRQLKAYRMFLFATVQSFIEANAHSTKLGTKSLFGLIEKALFEPVMKGRKEREPDAEEIRRRFTQLSATLPEKHSRIFQPYFQKYLQAKLKQLK